MKGIVFQALVVIALFGCNGATERVEATGAPLDSQAVQLLRKDLDLSWTLRSSEGEVAATGKCEQVALSYDRSITLMSDIIRGSSFEMHSSMCMINDKEKDQYLASYVVNAMADGGMVAVEVLDYDGANTVTARIRMNGTSTEVQGQVGFDGRVATVYLEVMLSELGMAPLMLDLVTAWSRKTGSKDGVSEVLEVELKAEFTPINAPV